MTNGKKAISFEKLLKNSSALKRSARSIYMELLQFKTVFLRSTMMEIISKMTTLYGKLEHSSLIIVHYNLYLLKLMLVQVLKTRSTYAN